MSAPNCSAVTTATVAFIQGKLCNSKELPARIDMTSNGRSGFVIPHTEPVSFICAASCDVNAISRFTKFGTGSRNTDHENLNTSREVMG